MAFWGSIASCLIPLFHYFGPQYSQLSEPTNLVKRPVLSLLISIPIPHSSQVMLWSFGSEFNFFAVSISYTSMDIWIIPLSKTLKEDWIESPLYSARLSPTSSHGCTFAPSCLWILRIKFFQGLKPPQMFILVSHLPPMWPYRVSRRRSNQPCDCGIHSLVYLSS